MTRRELIALFAPALNEAAGTVDFDATLADIRAVEDFLNGNEQPSLELENEE